MVSVIERWQHAGDTPFTNHLIQEPEGTYAARRSDHLSSHALAEFRKNPRLYRNKQLGLISEPERAAFALGRAAHCLVLEGRDAFAQRFAVGGPVNPKTGRCFGSDTKAFQEWAATQGRPVISEGDAALCSQLADAVQAHEEAQRLLDAGQAEGVVRTTYADLPCQGRFDWVHPVRGIVDLKTIDDLDWFEVQARSFGYAHQLAFYRSLLQALAGRAAPVHIIAVEKREPYRVGVWRFSDQVLDAAARENLAAIERLKISRTQDCWPTGYEQIRTFDYLA